MILLMNCNLIVTLLNLMFYNPSDKFDKFPHLSTALMFIELNQSGDTPDDVSVLIHDYHSGCT